MGAFISVHIYCRQSGLSTHYMYSHLPPYLPIHLPIHLFSRSSIHLIIYLFYMPRLDYIKETIIKQRNGLIKLRQLTKDQQDRVETAVKLLREGSRGWNSTKKPSRQKKLGGKRAQKLSRQMKQRGTRARALIRLIINKVGASSALLCGMCIAPTSLSDLPNGLHQDLCTWLATEEPKLDESTLQLFDQNVREAFGVEGQGAKIDDRPMSSSPITGQTRRLSNISNERPSTAPHATTVVHYGETSTTESMATCVIEETGKKGHLPKWMCKSQSLHCTS